MIEFLFINIVYVSYRLIVSAHIVKFFNKYMPYSFAVLIMSQVSFAYDFGIFAYLFSAQSLPAIMEIVQANIMYTLRVGIAWWIIKMLWDRLNNYYLAVFIGAEMTFAVDYFIFDGIF
jgi:hypothetical protein